MPLSFSGEIPVVSLLSDFLCSAKRIFFLCLVLDRLYVRDISSILIGSSFG